MLKKHSKTYEGLHLEYTTRIFDNSTIPMIGVVFNTSNGKYYSSIIKQSKKIDLLAFLWVQLEKRFGIYDAMNKEILIMGQIMITWIFFNIQEKL